MKQSSTTAFFMMKKIALIYMGGTFGCIGEPLSPMPEHDFFSALEKFLPSDYQFDFYAAPTIKDSSACTAADWLSLIQFIQQLQKQNHQHFIIIHGTDTLSYAAATLSRFLQQSCHVVITGSQYPLLNVHGTDIRDFTDAFDNLKLAYEQVQKLESGVYLAFNHEVFHGQTALKVHSSAFRAFYGVSSQNPITKLSHDTWTITKQHIDHIKQLNLLNLNLRPIETNIFNRQLENLYQQPPEVLIIQAYGTGNFAVDSTTLKHFNQLQQLGCNIVLDTQVLFGGLNQQYAISDWVRDAKLLVNNTHSFADLYAKILQMYLQYPASEPWFDHWYDL